MGTKEYNSDMIREFITQFNDHMFNVFGLSWKISADEARSRARVISRARDARVTRA